MLGNKYTTIYQKIRNRDRITVDEAIVLWEKAPWLEVCQLAHEIRCDKVGKDQASYTLFRIINYTNICNINCVFCGFYTGKASKKGYVLSMAQILEKTQEVYQQGVKQIFLQGGVNPDLKLDFYINMLKDIKAKYSDLHIRAFSPVEIREFSRINNLSVEVVLDELKQAGLDSVPGAGAEILSLRMRERMSPKKCSPLEWLQIMEQCHIKGLRGSCNIVFGSEETVEERFYHLELLRTLQDKTSGFDSFIPWVFQQQTKKFVVNFIPRHMYLKFLAISRIFLDNIQNIEVSVMVLGQDIGKLALHVGANDISSPVFEENVLESHSVGKEQEAIQLIQEAGFQAKYRNFTYDNQKN